MMTIPLAYWSLSLCGFRNGCEKALPGSSSGDPAPPVVGSNRTILGAAQGAFNLETDDA